MQRSLLLFLSLFSILDEEWGNIVTVLEFHNFKHVLVAKKLPSLWEPQPLTKSPNLACPGSSGPNPGPQAGHPYVFPLPLIGPLPTREAPSAAFKACRVCAHTHAPDLSRESASPGVTWSSGSVRAPSGQGSPRTSALVPCASAHSPGTEGSSANPGLPGGSP